MNLANLITKLKNLEEGIEVIGAPVGLSGGESTQQDTVTMSVNLNGSGQGGVRDLMDLLKGIEAVSNDHSSDEHPIMGDEEQFGPGTDHERDAPVDEFSELGPDHVAQETFDDDKEVWGNSAHGNSGHHTHGLDAVTFSGDDLNSKGKVSPAMRVPGTNALRAVSENLVNKLRTMYEEMKDESINELSNNTLKSYVKKAANDVGYHSFAAGNTKKGKPSDFEDGMNRQKHAAKAFTRQAGIERAVDKLAKEGKTWDAVKKGAKDMWNGTEAEHKAEKDTASVYEKKKNSSKYKVTHHPAGTKAPVNEELSHIVKLSKMING
jgi:hypothetical protein